MWKRLILVAGLRRGGTTWVGKVLEQAQEAAYLFEPDAPAAHPETPYTGTVTALRELPRWWLGAEDVERYPELAEGLRLHTEQLCVRAFGGPVDTLVIKIPQTERLPFLARIFEPDALIYIRRHPFGVLNSYDEHGLYRAWLGREWSLFLGEHEQALPELEIAPRAARHYVEKVLLLAHARLVLSERILPVLDGLSLQYEDLCLAPEQQFRALFGHLGWHWGEEVWSRLRPLVDPAPEEIETRGLFSTRKPSADRAFGWRRELAPHLLRRASRFAGHHTLPYALLGRGIPRRSLREHFHSLQMYRWRRAAYVREWGWREAVKWF